MRFINEEKGYERTDMYIGRRAVIIHDNIETRAYRHSPIEYGLLVEGVGKSFWWEGSKLELMEKRRLDLLYDFDEEVQQYHGGFDATLHELHSPEFWDKRSVERAERVVLIGGLWYWYRDFSIREV
jgi:hypothetical protein